MWLKSTDRNSSENASYRRYYERDGALRAYANRAMVLGFSATAIALLSLAFAAYVRLQPPTVIRVDANGEASIVGKPQSIARITVSQTAADAEATDIEKRAFMKLFLDRYLNFSPSNVGRNWAEALNMMTSNLQRAAIDKMQKENLVGKIQGDQMRSEFQLRRLEPVKDSPLTYTAFGTKEIHHVHEDHSETMEKIVSEFRLRLVVEKRTEQNPSGLLIGEYWEQPIEGERKNQVLQEAGLVTQD